MEKMYMYKISRRSQGGTLVIDMYVFHLVYDGVGKYSRKRTQTLYTITYY